MKNQLYTLLALAALILGSRPMKAQLILSDTSSYHTFEQMLLANEFNESGEPFAEALGYDLDLLDPMQANSPDSMAYTLGIENYEYSRYYLGTIVSQSGMGLHMMWAPMIKQMASMITDSSFDGSYTNGMKNGIFEDDVLMKMIGHLGEGANQTPPMNAWPQFAEFQSGDPRLPQNVQSGFPGDFQTLRWDRSKMDKTLNPAAMGQTLMKQYLWAQDMLSTFHDGSENNVEANGINTPDLPDGSFDPNNNIFLGGDNLDGFIGQVLTAEGINKVLFLINKLGYDGSHFVPIDPASYNPSAGIVYFPHEISVTESPVASGLPPQASQLTVKDAESHLWDQLSLLEGTLHFKNMMNPDDLSDEAHIAYHSVFDGDPFPAAMSVSGMPGPFDLMKGASAVLFKNIMAMHFDSNLGTFTDISELINGGVVRGNVVNTESSAYLLVILAKTIEEFAGTPLEGMARDALNAQANFLIANLKDTDGSFFSEYTIGSGVDGGSKTLSTQAAVIRGLYVAAEATGNNDFLAAADAAYAYLIATFYDPAQKVFRSEEGNVHIEYTPYNIALTAGALREASLIGNHADAALIYTRFFKRVVNPMQLNEFGPTGETGNDSDADGVPFILNRPGLPPVLASSATFDIQTGIADNKLKRSRLRVYPNPARSVLHVESSLKNGNGAVIEIFDISGRRQYLDSGSELSSGNGEILISLNTLRPGIYMLKISNKEEIQSSSFVVE